MKVAFFAHYAGIYGASQSLLTLVEGLRQRGVEPVVFLPEPGPMVKWLREREIRNEVLTYEPWMAAPRDWLLAPIRLWKNWRVRGPVGRRIRSLQPDLIHSNSSVVGIGIKTATDLNIPHVWHLREFAWEAFRMRPDRGWRDMRQWLERSAAYVAVSHSLKKHLLSPTAQVRCTVIYNGVMSKTQMESARRRRMQRVHQDGSSFTFLMIGRISPLKGQQAAIIALSQIQAAMPASVRLQLKIVGGGNAKYIERLRKLAIELGMDEQVDFAGFQENPFPLYIAADSVLVCSRVEGMGRVTAEAMGSGVPVIGRNSTGTAELIEHEQTGLLYDGGVESLSAAMVRLIEDRDLRVRVAQQGWEKAYADFSTETYCSRAHSLFEQVANRG